MSEKLGLDGGTLRGNTLGLDNGNGAVVAGASFAGLDLNAENGDIGRIQVYMLDGVYYASLATCYGGVWAVKNFATATLPTEYDLPLASGFTRLQGHRCHYSKDQFGVVLVTIACDCNISSGVEITIATLPAGYRPLSTVAFVVYDHMQKQFGRGQVGASGAIGATFDSDATRIRGEVFFLAGN